MKPSVNNVFWALGGAVVLGALLGFVFLLQGVHTPSERVALREQKSTLAAQLRLALASASEAEKSAVLAITDQDSVAFAEQSRAATRLAAERRAQLATLLQTSGTTKEKELLAQFSTAFTEFQRVDKELLELAVKNTNLKASALAFGPCAQALGAMDAALSRIMGTGAKAVVLPAATAQAAALRIQALLPPHIAEESDNKMDDLEAQMTKQDREVRRTLDQLATLLPSGNTDLQTATSSYARFSELRAQILKLSRENSNVRSLSISLNQKRKVTVLCQEALAALEQTIDQARTGSNVPTRPK